MIGIHRVAWPKPQFNGATNIDRRFAFNFIVVFCVWWSAVESKPFLLMGNRFYCVKNKNWVILKWYDVARCII